jgi:hypothetical protein
MHDVALLIIDIEQLSLKNVTMVAIIEDGDD